MKRITLLTLTALLSLSSTAQQATATPAPNKPFYMRVGFGYGFPLSGAMEEGNGTVVTLYNEENFNIKPYSYGAGLAGTLALGYNLSKNLGVEMVATSTAAGKNYKFSSVYEYNSGGVSYTEKRKATSYGNTLLLQPSFVVQTGGVKTNIYTRMGIIVPVMNLLVYDITYIESMNNNIVKTKEEYSMHFSLGATGAIGASFKLSEVLRLYSELCMVSYSPTLKKGVRTEYSRNGDDLLKYLSLKDREIEFEKTGKIVSSPAPDKPSVAQTKTIPFGNIGINAGLVIQL